MDRKYRIRSGSGLGDNLYLYPIAREVKKHIDLEIPTLWTELFQNLEITCTPKSKKNIDIVAHYVQRKRNPGTSQFDDMCWSAQKAFICRETGINLVRQNGTSVLDYTIDWDLHNKSLTRGIQDKAKGKKILFVGLPRRPMGRIDKFGAEISPVWEKAQIALLELKKRFFLVQVGKGPSLYNYTGIDLNLSSNTSVSDLMDIAKISDGFFSGGCSFIVPLSELLEKPALIVWSKRGLTSKEPFINAITPEKVIHKKGLIKYVIDDYKQETIIEKSNLFLSGIH